VAVEEENLTLLEKIWVFGKEAQLEPNKLKNQFLLAKDRDGYTAWHRVADKGIL